MIIDQKTVIMIMKGWIYYVSYIFLYKKEKEKSVIYDLSHKEVTLS